MPHPARKIDPKVQAYYDALSPEDRDALDEKLRECVRTLADMRFSVSTGKLDQRFLTPKIVVPRHDWIKEDDDAPDDELDEARDATKGRSKAAGHKLKLGENLKKGESLASYIKSSLGDGKALADFYLGILTLPPRECRKAGIWMNHKIESAKWLAERGWGKVGIDQGEKAPTQINIINYGEAVTQPKPETQAVEVVSRDIVTAESDAGRDKVTAEENPPLGDLVTSIIGSVQDERAVEPSVEEFDIRGDGDV